MDDATRLLSIDAALAHVSGEAGHIPGTGLPGFFWEQIRWLRANLAEERRIAEAVAIEREACAKIAESCAFAWNDYLPDNISEAANEIAAVIRARSGTT